MGERSPCSIRATALPAFSMNRAMDLSEGFCSDMSTGEYEPDSAPLDEPPLHPETSGIVQFI